MHPVDPDLKTSVCIYVCVYKGEWPPFLATYLSSILQASFNGGDCYYYLADTKVQRGEEPYFQGDIASEQGWKGRATASPAAGDGQSEGAGRSWWLSVINRLRWWGPGVGEARSHGCAREAAHVVQSLLELWQGEPGVNAERGPKPQPRCRACKAGGTRQGKAFSLGIRTWLCSFSNKLGTPGKSPNISSLWHLILRVDNTSSTCFTVLGGSLGQPLPQAPHIGMSSSPHRWDSFSLRGTFATRTWSQPSWFTSSASHGLWDHGQMGGL